MTTISKKFYFSASHVLGGLSSRHTCSRLHGHNYVLTIYLRGIPDRDGFVLDYRKLQPIKDFVDNVLDHRHLNDIFDCNPTVENITEKIFWMFKEQFPELVAVGLSETTGTECLYEPES